MTPTPERRAVLDSVADHVPAATRPLLVAVDGTDGAGKTWFADELAEVLSARGHHVVRASVDDFHFPRAHRHQHGRTAESVWERSFDYRALRRELLDPWRNGPGSSYRTVWHDLASDTYADSPPRPVPGHGVLLVDGIFAQRPELEQAWDLVVWLEAPVAVTVTRMAARDGTPADPDHPEQRRYVEAQGLYLSRCSPKERADLVVDNTDLARPVLLGEPLSPVRGAGAPVAAATRPYDDVLAAFAAAADWFLETVAKVGDRWDHPALGEWDVRALVGHASRSFLTVESYLAEPPEDVVIGSTADYYRATRELARGPGPVERGRQAGTALGADPLAPVTEVAGRVRALLAGTDGNELLTSIVGGMRLADYLPTRTFELAVHTADLASALGVPVLPPPLAAREAMAIVTELAVGDGSAGALLLAATGRSGLPPGFSVL